MDTLLISALIGIVMIATERVFPGIKMPKIEHWFKRAILFNLAQIAIIIVAGHTWNKWMRGTSIFNASECGLLFGALITYFVSTFIYYWWHRVRHESHFWWRFAHQIHHSAERIEILTSFYKHPFEIIINSVLSAFIVYPLMGCTTEQGALYTLFIAVGEMFYHWNIHTPRWIGHIFQRPESHRIHHHKNVHTKNYGDLPIFDKLFGTFSNPKNADNVKCGFTSGKENEIGAMLLGLEVETKRRSDPIKFGPICFSCHKKHRCEKESQTN